MWTEQISSMPCVLDAYCISPEAENSSLFPPFSLVEKNTFLDRRSVIPSVLHMHVFHVCLVLSYACMYTWGNIKKIMNTCDEGEAESYEFLF